ncbi:uracil-xanthine permease family protein [Garciella nitratireducens]|uniref:uracil-xanthine permease family protein n=1 Tax=Garciella nitratireducens TaxID=218205 RepID=UPI000E00288A|nr:solute carrier family 23 protein [Garciella nitratireducens]RBP40658.1 uracil permease [Garciella nitratireducens]
MTTNKWKNSFMNKNLSNKPKKDGANKVTGYLPDEKPEFIELILFALQQIIVMFPATVLVALITGFHVSTTIFASGLATLGFILITRKKIPLYYGSSFSYIAAIASIMSADTFSGYSLNDKISIAQFGIVMSGFVSIFAGIIIQKSGKKLIDKVLPPTITGSIAIIIGLSLAGNAMGNAAAIPPTVSKASQQIATNYAWLIAIITLFSTILYSVYLKGKLSQLPILFGLLTGYFAALVIGLISGISFVNFHTIQSSSILNLPIFTFPKPSWEAVIAIMPIAIATIPESTAHVYQLDTYVNNLAKKKGINNRYDIAGNLGLNLVGDGIGDMISGMIGGPAGTNYGENLSTMAISKNFSVPVLIAASILTMIIACFTPLINLIYSIPTAVIGGLSIYLYGVIAAQGITIMLDKKVDLFSSKNLAVIAVILIIGLGGTYSFEGGMIPMFGVELPSLATAAVVGILLNLMLSFREDK